MPMSQNPLLAHNEVLSDNTSIASPLLPFQQEYAHHHTIPKPPKSRHRRHRPPTANTYQSTLQNTYKASNRKRLWNYDPNSRWAPRHASHPLLDRVQRSTTSMDAARKKKKRRSMRSETKESRSLPHTAKLMRRHDVSALHSLERNRDVLLAQLDEELHLGMRHSSLNGSTYSTGSEPLHLSNSGRNSVVENHVDESILLGNSLKARLSRRDLMVFDQFVQLLSSFKNATEREGIVMEAVKEAEDVLLFQLYNKSNVLPNPTPLPQPTTLPKPTTTPYYDPRATPSPLPQSTRRRSDSEWISTKPPSGSRGGVTQVKMPEINSRTSTPNTLTDLMSGLLLK